MKEIHVDVIRDTVARLCIEANKVLPDDLTGRLQEAAGQETDPLGREILSDLERNLDAAARLDVPVCQDTGMAVVFAEVGQEVHIAGGLLEDAVNAGVRKGYVEGLLRLSVVSDPMRRVNSGDNTPAVLHTRLTAGDSLRLTVAPKGFGSENMSGIRMLTPAAGREAVIAAVTDIVRAAGSNPCPPMVLGVGIGGDFELCAFLAKKALCRSLSQPNPDPYYAELERDMLEAVNGLGIGPQGFGGRTTALGLNIEAYPTHIAGLPVAVNVGCHVTRHKTAVL
ncbi:MAG TPA: fumarate hydratase [Firmicutes bacterium]|nr:fumarate hydratase [Bacillota bacterium]